MIFSVPWKLDGKTQEHFPELFEWETFKFHNSYILVNRTKEGRLQVFDNLCFHGGPGQTLEMRLFSLDDLMMHFREAGFAEVNIFEGEYLPHGIRFDPCSRGMVARAGSKCGVPNQEDKAERERLSTEPA
ncbi:MAG: hypothetical protein JO061_08840 [Acidobacteriaceae bacterium]|nr:hypothetical protein [Acidobacteriaceae bacterium]